MIAQDEKNLKGFLKEQIQDQEMNKYYGVEEARGAPVDHSSSIKEQHDTYEVKEKTTKDGYYKKIEEQA
jgi:hypothetical protein